MSVRARNFPPPALPEGERGGGTRSSAAARGGNGGGGGPPGSLEAEATARHDDLVCRSNIMFDCRVVRGNTYASPVVTEDQMRNREAYEKDRGRSRVAAAAASRARGGDKKRVRGREAFIAFFSWCGGAGGGGSGVDACTPASSSSAHSCILLPLSLFPSGIPGAGKMNVPRRSWRLDCSPPRYSASGRWESSHGCADRTVHRGSHVPAER